MHNCTNFPIFLVLSNENMFTFLPLQLCKHKMWKISQAFSAGNCQFSGFFSEFWLFLVNLKTKTKIFRFLSTVYNLNKVLSGMQYLCRACCMVFWHNKTLGQASVSYHSPVGVCWEANYKLEAKYGSV